MVQYFFPKDASKPPIVLNSGDTLTIHNRSSNRSGFNAPLLFSPAARATYSYPLTNAAIAKGIKNKTVTLKPKL